MVLRPGAALSELDIRNYVCLSNIAQKQLITMIYISAYDRMPLVTKFSDFLLHVISSIRPAAQCIITTGDGWFSMREMVSCLVPIIIISLHYSF